MVRRRWIVLGGIPLLPALLVAVRPNALGNGRFFNLYNMAMLASVAVLAFGVWRWRPRPVWPWVMIALTIGLWVTGDLVFGSHASPPTLSFADVFHLAGYVTVVLGVLRLVRVGVGRRNADSILDMLIVGVAAMYASWALVIEPTLARSDVSYAARLILVAYPVMDAALLVLLAQLMLGSRPTMSHVFLALGIAIVFAGDIGFAVVQQTNSFTSWSILDASWPFGYAVIALSALHPSVRVLPGERAGEDRAVDPRRLLAASAAVLSVPTVAVIADSLNRELDRMALMTASISLFVLVSWRTLRLYRQAESSRSALELSTQYFRELAMNSSDAFAVITDNGIVTDASPQLERVIGWPRDHIVGTPIAAHLNELVYRDDKTLATSFLARGGARPTVGLRRWSSVCAGRTGASDG